MRTGLVVLMVVIAALFLVLLATVSVGEEATEEKTAEKKMMKEEMMKMPFGGAQDVAFAEVLWTAMEGHENWIMRSEIIPGKSPHGMFVRMSYGLVTIDGRPYHVINKDNYGGEGVTLDMVNEDPGAYLMALTPMVQREAGYDPDNNDWFWVKFGADGAVATTDDGVAIAGRFAKGMPMGCIACHANAADGDYLFAND